MAKKINIAIIGATGFTGLDLVFLLSKHPKAKILNLCATKSFGKDISYFDKRIKKKLPKISSISKINWNKINLVFLSMPNGEAQKLIKKLYFKYNNLKFIDLSADFRISNSTNYKKNYNIDHKAKKLIKKAIYSITEFEKENIHNFRIIANPGCYPTSIQIPLVPIIKKNLINTKDITINSKSGFSGAGKNFRKKFTHKNIYSSIFAYSVTNHRHVVEIDQELSRHTKRKIKFTFNPYLLPTYRGILTTIHVYLKKNKSIKHLRDELIKFYHGKKFIKIMKLNSSLGTGDVLNTNMCQISLCKTRVNNKIAIFCAIDNLIKGASGQAIQNMNAMFNYSEKLGLK